MGMLMHRHSVNAMILKAQSEMVEPMESSVEVENTEEVVEQPIEQKSEEPKYTKSDIAKMPVAELKVVAKELGVATSGVNGFELKKKIVAKLGL